MMALAVDSVSTTWKLAMYKQRNLKFEFTAEPGILDDKNNTTLVVENCKAQAQISMGTNVSGNMADVKIYGLSAELISSLSAKGVGAYNKGSIKIGMNILADDEMVFSGGIYACYADMNEMPEVGLVINAMAGLDLMRASTKPFTLKGYADYSDIINSICIANGYTYEGFNVTGGQTNGYYEGSPLEQIRALCLNARLRFAVNSRKVTVWPIDLDEKGNIDRSKELAAQVSPEHGLIGYPVYSPAGLTIQAEFSTYIFSGGLIDLTTTLPNASGRYIANVVTHYLSSWIKGGPWYTVCLITPLGKRG